MGAAGRMAPASCRCGSSNVTSHVTHVRARDFPSAPSRRRASLCLPACTEPNPVGRGLPGPGSLSPPGSWVSACPVSVCLGVPCWLPVGSA